MNRKAISPPQKQTGSESPDSNASDRKVKPSTQPATNMHDLVLRAQLTGSKDIDFSSYFLCLAAYQRGLTVTFHRKLRNDQLPFIAELGYKAELFSISDGKTTRYFSRTIGDLTAPSASTISNDKHQTKSVLTKAGIPTPKGIVVFKSQIGLVKKFIDSNPGLRFVVKPFDGSLARGVHKDLPAEDVISTVEAHTDDRLVVEQYIVGAEYRVYVVAGRTVAVFKREPPNVVGTGDKSIEELIAEKNLIRENNLNFKGSPIPLNDIIIGYLQRHGMTLKDRPESGRRVVLSNSLRREEGVDHVDVTGAVSAEMEQASIAASKALDIPNCGIDVIVSQEDGKPYVLEVNARANISSHTYPLYGKGQGNAIAEAIIDMYFPKSVANKRFPNAVIYIATILNMLKKGLVSEVTLPTLAPDWKQSRVKLDPDFSEQSLKNIKLNLLHYGLYGQILKVNTQQTYLDVWGHKGGFDEFMKMFKVKK